MKELKDGQWIEGICDECGSEIIADCNIENYKGQEESDWVYFCSNEKCQHSIPQEGIDQMTTIYWSKKERDEKREEIKEREKALEGVKNYIDKNTKEEFLKHIKYGIENIEHNCVEWYRDKYINCNYNCEKCWNEFLDENKNKILRRDINE